MIACFADQINVDVHSVQLVEAKEQTSGALANFFNDGILAHTLGRFLPSFAHCLPLCNVVT